MTHALLLSVALTLMSADVLAHEAKRPAPARIDYASAEETPFGRAADPKRAKRIVRIEMNDRMRFVPDAITLKRGELVRFVAANKGQVLHEMVIGTMEDLKAHAELMRKHPGMEHDEPHMVHVAPGRSGEIGWQFTRSGTFYFACLIPGHFEAGMIGRIVVNP